jgi:hypothetical protein
MSQAPIDQYVIILDEGGFSFKENLGLLPLLSRAKIS